MHASKILNILETYRIKTVPTLHAYQYYDSAVLKYSP